MNFIKKSFIFPINNFFNKVLFVYLYCNSAHNIINVDYEYKKIPIIEQDRYTKALERYEVGFRVSPNQSMFLPGATLEELIDLRDVLNARIETELLKAELKQINVNTNENLS